MRYNRECLITQPRSAFMNRSRLGLILVFVLAPPLWSQEAKQPENKTYDVPYRLTNAKHVLVRVKLNGKGPFNLIVDTGAPALILSPAVGKKLGIEPEPKGANTFDRFEVEGGVALTKVRGLIRDMYQLQGMNSLGLAGVELHGV